MLNNSQGSRMEFLHKKVWQQLVKVRWTPIWVSHRQVGDPYIKIYPLFEICYLLFTYAYYSSFTQIGGSIQHLSNVHTLRSTSFRIHPALVWIEFRFGLAFDYHFALYTYPVFLNFILYFHNSIYTANILWFKAVNIFSDVYIYIWILSAGYTF